MKKYQVVDVRSCEEFLVLETDDLKEAIGAASAEWKHLTAAEKEKSKIEVRTNFSFDITDDDEIAENILNTLDYDTVDWSGSEQAEKLLNQIKAELEAENGKPLEHERNFFFNADKFKSFLDKYSEEGWEERCDFEDVLHDVREAAENSWGIKCLLDDCYAENCVTGEFPFVLDKALTKNQQAEKYPSITFWNAGDVWLFKF